jgi:hypothetical protein
VECYCFWFLDRWLFGSSKYVFPLWSFEGGWLPNTAPILGGPRSAFGSAVACGILLGVFEGVGVLVSRIMNDNTRPQLPPLPENMQPQPS